MNIKKLFLSVLLLPFPAIWAIEDARVNTLALENNSSETVIVHTKADKLAIAPGAIAQILLTDGWLVFTKNTTAYILEYPRAEIFAQSPTKLAHCDVITLCGLVALADKKSPGFHALHFTNDSLYPAKITDLNRDSMIFNQPIPLGPKESYTKNCVPLNTSSPLSACSGKLKIDHNGESLQLTYPCANILATHYQNANCAYQRSCFWPQAHLN